MQSVLERRHDAVVSFMQHEPQTNETNRSLALLPGFLLLARSFPGLPLACFEIGASAGLNTLWPSFHYQLDNDGRLSWGDPLSPVRLSSQWSGAAFPAGLLSAKLSVRSVRGSDQRPVDLSQPDERLRLRSYVWPTQRERVERLQRAMELAQQRPVQVEQADAADWTERQLQLQPGVVSVLYHSVVWQYLPAATRARITAHMQRLGQQATAASPLAWLSMEPGDEDGWHDANSSGHGKDHAVRLTLWPGGSTQLLAMCGPHGNWMEMKYREE